MQQQQQQFCDDNIEHQPPAAATRRARGLPDSIHDLGAPDSLHDELAADRLHADAGRVLRVWVIQVDDALEESPLVLLIPARRVCTGPQILQVFSSYLLVAPFAAAAGDVGRGDCMEDPR